MPRKGPAPRRELMPDPIYRSVLVIPYAMPGFLSLLVWAGLLNDDFGVVNHILHVHVPWLFGSVWWARVSIILVSTWLTFPYFFLVSMGALQSIPAELDSLVQRMIAKEIGARPLSMEDVAAEAGRDRLCAIARRPRVLRAHVDLRGEDQVAVAADDDRRDAPDPVRSLVEREEDGGVAGTVRPACRSRDRRS